MTHFLRYTHLLCTTLFLLSSAQKLTAETKETSVNRFAGKIVSDLDKINRKLAEEIDAFLEKNPNGWKIIIPLFIKFTGNIEKIKMILNEKQKST
jgi:uncharacterized protein YpmS